MKIKYLGHASFVITSDTGVKIITDPYIAGGAIGYGEIRESADIVVVSHDHFDHNNVAAVGGKAKPVRGAITTNIKGVAFKGIPSYHDDAGGRQRGNNTIFCFEVDGIRVCHFGDLGHQLSAQQVAELGRVDIVLIPVGGSVTLDARGATEVCNKLKPKVIMPMHYKTAKCGLLLAGVDDFLRGKENVKKLDASEVEFKQEELPSPTQIIVLKSAL